MMTWLVWIGTAFAGLGLVGILWSAVKVSAAKKAATDDADLRARLTKLIPLNIGGFLLAVLGVMMVMVGVLLS